MDRHTVRKTLLAQHERIRQDVTVCRRLSERLRAGDPVERELDVALVQLRSDFDDHNRTETGLLLPLLLRHAEGRDTRGTHLAERMLEEHAAEHAAFWMKLDAPRPEVLAELDEVLDDLDAHMAAEERTFLSPLILRAEEVGRVLCGGEPISE